MSDLADLKTVLATLTAGRAPGHALALAATIAETLARDLDDDRRVGAAALGRMIAKRFDANAPDLVTVLDWASSLDVGAAPPVGVDVEPADLAAPLPERLAGALLRTEAGEAVLAVRAERAAQARAALAPAEAALVEAQRLARQLGACRRRAAELQARFEVAREALTRAGAASRVAVDDLLVEVAP